MRLRCWSAPLKHLLCAPNALAAKLNSAAMMVALCFADVLVAKPQTAALLLDWCSSRSRLAAPQVLLHLWRQEERRQGLCTEVGVLADVDWPLKPRKTDERWIPELSAMYGLQDKHAR